MTLPRNSAEARVDANGSTFSLTYFASDGLDVYATVQRANGTVDKQHVVGLTINPGQTMLRTALYDSGNTKFAEVVQASAGVAGVVLSRIEFADTPAYKAIAVTQPNGQVVPLYIPVPNVTREETFSPGQFRDVKVFSGSHLVSREITSLSNGFHLSATYDPVTSQHSVSILRNGASSAIISNDGGSFTIDGLARMEAASLISNDGGSLVAQGGGNFTINMLVASGGGNLRIDNPLSLISEHGAGLVRAIKDAHFDQLALAMPQTYFDIEGIQQQLVATGGGNLVATGGGNLVATGGGNLVAQGGGNLVAQGGGNLLALDGGPFRLLGLGDRSDPVDDFAGHAGTSGTVVPGGFAEGHLEIDVINDTDWFKVELVQGQTYTFDLTGADGGEGDLLDPELFLYNNSFNGSTGTTGVIIMTDDEGGPGHDARILNYTATYSGTHYLEARSARADHDANPATASLNVSFGSYKLHVSQAGTAPTVTSSSAPNVAEYQTYVQTVTAFDPQQGGSGLKFFVSGGEDAVRFQIDQLTGNLSFRVAPDYERPTDVNGDNIYKVEVKAVDVQGNVGTQLVNVAVTDVSEPDFSFPSNVQAYTINAPENSGPGSIVTYLEASESTGGNPNYNLAFEITGPDARWFTIGNAPNGQGKYLSWATGVNPDYELPRDAGLNNVYNIDVRATNPSTLRYDTVSITINVTDQADPSITGLPSGQAVNDNATKNPFANTTVANVTSVTVTLSSIANGTFAPGSLGGFASNGNGVYTMTGTAAALTTALRGLVFDPTDNQVPDGQQVTTNITVQASNASSASTSETTQITAFSVPDAPPTTLAIVASSADQMEGGPGTQNNFVFYVERSGTLSGTSTVNWAVSGPAVNGADFVGGVLPSGTITFAPNQIIKPFAITVAGDSSVELDESFTVTLSNPSGAAISTATASGIIRNDDAATPEVSVSYLGTNIVDGDASPSGLDGTSFGTVRVGGSAVDHVFTVTNSGTVTLTTSGLTLPTGFTLVEGLSASIAAGASDTFTVRLNPTGPGVKTGQITFATNDGDENPFNFAIAGTVRNNAAQDFNADGRSDILWRQPSTGAAVEWSLTGGSGQAPAFAAANSLPKVGSEWRLDGKGDFTGDGTADILFRHTGNGQTSIWKMANGTYAGAGNLGMVGLQWQIAGTADFDGDTDHDILWRNTSTGDVAVWTLQNGAYAASGSLFRVGLDWQVAGTGDFGGDGKADILWRNGTTGQMSIWELNGAAYTGSINAPTVAGPWRVDGTGDFGGDGRTDVLWRNTQSGQVAVWQMNDGAITASGSPGTVGLAWQIQEVGDYSSDGLADILWRNTSTGEVATWALNGSTYAGGGSLGMVGNDWFIA